MITAEIGNRRSGQQRSIPPAAGFRNRKMGFVFSAAGIVGDLRSDFVLGGDARHDQANAIPPDEGFRNRKIGFAFQPVGQVPFPNNHSVANSRLLTVRCHEPCYIPVIIVLDNPCLRILSDPTVPEDFESIQ